MDFEIDVPIRFEVQRAASKETRVRIDIVGERPEELSESIVKQASAAGFVKTTNAPDWVELERNEHRIVVVFDETGLTLQAFYPAVLPPAT